MAQQAIDRDKITPTLLRVFWRNDGHNSDGAYSRDNLPGQELHFYTWPDATLKELTQLLKDVVPTARKRGARLEFSLVYPDSEGRNKMRVVGSVRNNNRAPDDARTLRDLRFQVGDYLDIAILSDEGGRGGMGGYYNQRGDRGGPMGGIGGRGGGGGGFYQRGGDRNDFAAGRRRHDLDR